MSEKELRAALARIALGQEGRRASGFLPGETRDGFPNMARTDWELAEDALALSSEPASTRSTADLAALERLAGPGRSRQADREVLGTIFGDIPGEEWDDREMAQFVLRVGAWFRAARPVDGEGLREALERLINAAMRQPNGYHVCRWCGQNIGDYTSGHAPDCQWVRDDRELAEAKAQARAALDADKETER